MRLTNRGLNTVSLVLFFCSLVLLGACGNDSKEPTTPTPFFQSNIWDGTYFIPGLNGSACDKTTAPVEQQSPALTDYSVVGAAHWQDYLDNINAVIDQPYDINLIEISILGEVPGANKFHGGVLAPDGTIFFIPSSLGLVYYYHPDEGILRNFSGVGAVNQAWSGGVLGPNGKIYSLPWALSNNRILEIDPVSKAIRFITVNGGGYAGQILAANGKIYGLPDSANNILEFDPATDQVQYIAPADGSLNGGRKFFGAALAPNGSIYGIPLNADQVLRFDPDTKEVSYFGLLPNQILKWAGGVLAPNGKIYAVPDDAEQILIIDTNNDTVELIGQVGTEPQKWSFGVFAPNGRIYFIPDDARGWLEIDWRDNSVIAIGEILGFDKWNGAVMGQNGKFYMVPDSSSLFVELDLCLEKTFDHDVLLSSYFNKY